VNVTKCDAVVFSKGHPTPNPNINLNNTDITWKEEVKSFGVLLDRKLTFSKHIIPQFGKASGRLAQLMSLLVSERAYLHSKVTLYKMLIRPIITYAAPAWVFAA